MSSWAVTATRQSSSGLPQIQAEPRQRPPARRLGALTERIGGPADTVHRMVATIIDCPRKIARYKENFIEPRRKLYAQIIRRGKQRGQIREDADEEVLVDLFSGAYFYCLLFTPEKLANGGWLLQVKELLELGLRKS